MLKKLHVRRLLSGSIAVLLAGVLVSLAAGRSSTASITPSAPSAGRWVIRDLGTFGGPHSEAVAINERGQIVGTASTTARDGRAWVKHAFVWTNGELQDLGTLGGRNSEARDINNSGQVVGAAAIRQESEGKPITHAFLWENGAMKDLGTLGEPHWESDAVDINERGQVVGHADTEDWRDGGGGVAWHHAFLWQEGHMRDLGTLGWHGGLTEAVAINDRGQIVGVDRLGYYTGTYYETKAFLWANGRMRFIGTLGGSYSRVSDINERGQIVGSAQPRGSTHYEDPHVAFLWQNGKMSRPGKLTDAHVIDERGRIVGSVDTTRRDKYGFAFRHAYVWRSGTGVDVGTLGGPASVGVDINRRGWIVGTADTPRKNKDGYAIGHAFVWQNGKMIDLGTLGGLSSAATAINDNGWIVGWATTKSGNRHAVVWRPK